MIEIIPAIDIIGGKCVRLTQGDYARHAVYGNPLDMAKRFEDAGCQRLHLVDLDGAKSKHVINHKTLEEIATHTRLVIDFGGGIKSEEDLHIAFESGAEMVTGGSIAVQEPEIMEAWLNEYGANRIILGADARNGKIATAGWIENSEIDVVPFIEHYVSKGITQVISTDISVDGTLSGPAIPLYEEIMGKVPGITLIASGGIGSLSDIHALDQVRIPSVIVGKAIYEGRIPLKEIARLNMNR